MAGPRSAAPSRSSPEPQPRASRISRWATAHPLGAFVGLAYAISWAFFIPAALGFGGGLVVLGAFGPALAAGVVIHWTGGSVRDWLGGLRRWRVPARYYLFALALPPMLVAATEAELALLGDAISLPGITRIVPEYLGTLVLVALLGGGQEEPGWRGFALDRYQEHHSPLTSTVLLGLVWGGWHLPVYGLGGFGGPVLFVIFYTWLYNRSGSVLLCVLMHASFNTAVGYLKVGDSKAVVSVVLVLTVAAATAVLIVVTKGRLGAAEGRDHVRQPT